MDQLLFIIPACPPLTDPSRRVSEESQKVGRRFNQSSHFFKLELYCLFYPGVASIRHVHCSSSNRPVECLHSLWFIDSLQLSKVPTKLAHRLSLYSPTDSQNYLRRRKSLKNSLFVRERCLSGLIDLTGPGSNGSSAR